MISEVVKTLNEYYGSETAKATYNTVENGVYRVNLPNGEPGVNMSRFLRERFASGTEFTEYEKEDATTWIVESQSY